MKRQNHATIAVVWRYLEVSGGRFIPLRDLQIHIGDRGGEATEHCLRIARVLEISPIEVLEAAGYPPSQDDSYNTYAVLLNAVENEGTWTEEKWEQVRAALIEAISPDFAFSPDATEWKDLATLVLQQKFSPTAKAEKIAHIVELWHHTSHS